MFLNDAAARRETTRVETKEVIDDIWGELLDSLRQPSLGPSYVLNAANPTVGRLADSRDEALQALGVEALYAHALVSGQHRLRPFDSALVARSLPDLIAAALERNGS